MSKRKMSKGSVAPVASEVRVIEDEFMGCFKTKELAERFGKVFRYMSEQEQEEMVVNHERIGILRQLYMEGRDDLLTVVFSQLQLSWNISDRLNDARDAIRRIISSCPMRSLRLASKRLRDIADLCTRDKLQRAKRMTWVKYLAQDFGNRDFDGPDDGLDPFDGPRRFPASLLKHCRGLKVIKSGYRWGFDDSIPALVTAPFCEIPSCLTSLTIENCAAVTSIRGIESCSKTLERINLSNTSVLDLSPLSGFIKLRLLHLCKDEDNFRSKGGKKPSAASKCLTPLSTCTNLKVLEVWWPDSFHLDFTPLVSCKKLNRLVYNWEAAHTNVEKIKKDPPSLKLIDSGGQAGWMLSVLGGMDFSTNDLSYEEF